jgi:hypothetical protein
MTILEIARLAVERAGFGLLPIVSGVLFLITIALVLQSKQRTLLVSGVSLFVKSSRRPDADCAKTLFVFWTLSVIVESIKVSRLQLLNALDPSKTSKYPSSDKLLDNAVIVSGICHSSFSQSIDHRSFFQLALYAVFLCVEGFTISILTKRKPFPSCTTTA